MLARKKPGTRVRCRKTCLVWRGAIFLVLVVLAFYTGGDKESEPKTSSRKLQEVSLFDGVIGKECSDFESSGGFVLHIIGVLVTFLGLAIICDDFFVESLEKISSALNLSDDVAGATFMAAGSSAPELMTAFVTSVLTDDGAAGVGTIVGSAIFNILMIVGITAFFAGQTLDIWWYPLSRDACWYMFSVAILMITMRDGELWWYEGLILFLSYGGYIIYMTQNEKVAEWARCRDAGNEKASPGDSAVHPFDESSSALDTPGSKSKKENNGGTSSRRDSADSGHHGEAMNPKLKSAFRRTTLNMKDKEEARATARASVRRKSRQEGPSGREPGLNSPGGLPEIVDADDTDSDSEEKKKDTKDDEEEAELTGAAKVASQVVSVIGWPINMLFMYTVPDCGKPRWESWYMVTFTACIVWIGVFTFFMVDFVHRLGLCWNVPSLVMGLLVLAAGTSVPDALSSILVARNGQGDMAIANALGSNIFDILIGLGIPWFIAAMKVTTTDKVMMVPSDGLVGNAILLVLALALFIGCIAGSGWKLKPSVGGMLCAVYGLFATWTLLTNLPDGDAIIKLPDWY